MVRLKKEKLADNKNGFVGRTIDRTVEFLFSNDSRKWALIIFIFGLILRILVARNISPSVADEMVHGPHAIGFLHSGLISTIVQAPVWFYLTDIMFKIFNVTLFSVRSLSVFYGAFCIILVYMIFSKIESRKIALVTSFLLSISYFTLRYTLSEMDLAALFFLLFALYLFLDYKENEKLPLFAAVCVGIASLIKTISLFFVPAFIIGFFLYSSKNKRINKKVTKQIILFGLIVTLIFSPILIHNFLLYENKELVDVYFAQYFDIGGARQAYTGLLGYNNSLFSMNLFNGLILMSKVIFNYDPLIISLGLIGLFYFFFSSKEKRKDWIVLISFELSGFILLLVASNWLATHYVYFVPVLCFFGAFFVVRISEKISGWTKQKGKYVLSIILIIVLFFQMFYMPIFEHIASRSSFSQLRGYAIENMNKNSVVVADSRIYRGRIAFLFHDFHYLESSAFPKVWDINKNLPGEGVAIDTYFVECINDDCGWGTIKDQPEFNQSTEEFFNVIKNNSQLEKIFYSGSGIDDNGDMKGVPMLAVYHTRFAFKPQSIQLIDSTHEWFFYPVNYYPKEKSFDWYDVNGGISYILHLFAWIILITSIVLALAAPIYMVYLLSKKR
jgi:hypothetical protein